MDNNNEQQTDKRIAIPKRNIIKFLIICVIALFVVFGGISYLINSSRAAELKKEASNVELAFFVTIREADIRGEKIYDAKSENMLTENGYSHIKELCGFEGDIYVTKWDEKNNLPLEMYIYSRKGFSAYYTKTDGKGEWEIVKNGSYRLF